MPLSEPASQPVRDRRTHHSEQKTIKTSSVERYTFIYLSSSSHLLFKQFLQCLCLHALYFNWWLDALRGLTDSQTGGRADRMRNQYAY